MAKRVTEQILKQIICLCMVAIVMAPILLTLFAALKTKADMANTSPLLLPPLERITFDNFEKVLTDKYLLLGFKNTAIILVVSLIFMSCLERSQHLLLNVFSSGEKRSWYRCSLSEC